MNNILVYCELVGSRVAEVSLELLSEGRSLADRLGVSLEAVAIGYDLNDVPSQVCGYGVDKIHLFDDRRFQEYATLPQASVLCRLVKSEGYGIFLLGATAVGSDLAPRVSAELCCGLTADCTSMDIGDYRDENSGKVVGNLLLQNRPAFGSNMVATIVSPYARPQMATVREGVMLKRELPYGFKETVEVRHNVADYVADTDFVIDIIERHVKPCENTLKSAQIVVAGGYGMGSKENFDMLYELAEILHGDVGATRAAIDAGYTTSDRQIGSTGLTVRPKVYFACGISGHVQHVTGIQDSGVIVSINSDPDAPINSMADYVITGRVEEILPKLITYYKQKR